MSRIPAVQLPNRVSRSALHAGRGRVPTEIRGAGGMGRGISLLLPGQSVNVLRFNRPCTGSFVFCHTG